MDQDAASRAPFPFAEERSPEPAPAHPSLCPSPLSHASRLGRGPVYHTLPGYNRRRSPGHAALRKGWDQHPVRFDCYLILSRQLGQLEGLSGAHMGALAGDEPP